MLWNFQNGIIQSGQILKLKIMKTHHFVIGGLLVTAVTVSVLSENIQSSPPVSRNIIPEVQPQPAEPLISALPAKEEAILKKDPVVVSKSVEPEKCVFKTAFEGVGLEDGFYYKIPGKIVASINEGLDWLESAQNRDGGWGAGSHSRQDVRDPHAVQSDPATTAMVAMALQRNGTTLKEGKYSENLRSALEFLLDQVESSPENSANITSLTYTQPQSKLGQNIDVVLTSQFLTNINAELDNDPELKQRVRKSIRKCIAKIEDNQNADGSHKGNGWAGVLQSSFATSALESAKSEGFYVDDQILEKSKDYQKNNIDVTTNSVETESAAGVVLYSVSGSTRATAKETAEAKDKIKQAKKEGKIQNEEVTVDNLKKAGLDENKAMQYSTSYNINRSAKKLAQDDNVITGYGNNGGEEFLSFLQTGEGMIMSKDMDWQKWYDKTSGRLLSIQNNDGSWNGHHCITSPVFCTATCLLILSVNNDIDKLTMNNISNNTR